MRAQCRSYRSAAEHWVAMNGAKLTTVDLNPWLISVGVGYRF